MADHRKALPARTEVRPASPPVLAPLGSARLRSAPLQPLDFDGTLTLSDAALRAIACESAVPGARLAAAWRLMIRGQALPTGVPGKGLRLLTLLNLATQQELEILDVLVCLDPAPLVRAQAATLLWRVARDRDRVVDRLVSQLEKEGSPEVLMQLLSLVPALPLEKARSGALSLLCHPSLDVRRASWRYWRQSGGPLERAVTNLIWCEPSRELRARCLLWWANDPSYADMLRELETWRESTGQVLEALSLARRFFKLTELPAPLDDRHLDTVLRMARRPFDVADRRILVSLTGLRVLEWEGADGGPLHGRSRLGWMGDALWRCLYEAYSSHDAPALTDEEKAWVPVLGAKIKALEAATPAAEEGDEDMDAAGGIEDVRRLLCLLTSSPAS